ncbi:MAG: sugar transferase [Clostridiales Family XIII bacterium]|jgi:undecaprenyl phosphate N,N'-diacetylbacillosamine 1-phosphate transferase|nr:sugar transferase [Clostridiales Family XIII bacterium]
MYKYIKRMLDFVAAFVMLLVLCIPMLILSLLVAVKLGRPVLFSQERPGLDEKIFRIQKFRTMTDEVDANGTLLPDAVRLTRFGSLLRSTSLDELPELINIVKGEMSFVGPRPLLVRYLNRYNDEQKRRHDVRPGLTGLAQVNGRNAISWEQKFEYDVYYVDHMSFLLDLKIVIKTFTKVFSRSDISADGEATMAEFMGTDQES